MKIGFLKSLLFYLIGVGLAAISHFTIGHPYIHAPALHHLIIFLTFTIGFLWLIFASIRYFAGNRTESLRGVMFVNLFISLVFALIMAYIIHDTTDNRHSEKSESKIIVEESGDTNTMYHEFYIGLSQAATA